MNMIVLINAYIELKLGTRQKGSSKLSLGKNWIKPIYGILFIKVWYYESIIPIENTNLFLNSLFCLLKDCV